jgi:hypothetical protein
MAAKSLSENGVNSYHVAKDTPFVGVVCILTSVHICLYDLGIIDWRLFLSEDDFELNNVCVLFIVAFVGFGGIFLICLSRVCITISSHHLKYRGILTTKMIPWAGVTRIMPGKRRDSLAIWSGSTRVQIDEMIFSKHRELCESIIDHVRKVSPHVKIDPRPRWWRFAWRRQRRDDL